MQVSWNVPDDADKRETFLSGYLRKYPNKPEGVSKAAWFKENELNIWKEIYAGEVKRVAHEAAMAALSINTDDFTTD